MKLLTIRRCIAAVAGVFGFCALAIQASADTIYYDDFNDQQNLNAGGPYTQTLAGSVPTTRSGTQGGSASATWLAGVESGGWGQRDYADNNVATPTSSNFLAFSPDSSRVYTVEATIDTTPLGGADPGGTGSWFTLGFTSSQHNWNGSDGSTIDTAHLVRWYSNQVATITYTVSGADLVAAGIQYVGWITDRPGTVNLNGSGQVRIDNFKLTSGVPNPTVTYDGNGSDGGSIPTDPGSPYTYGGTATVVGAGTMTRTGFNFNGWNTAANGTGTDYSPAATFTIENNTTLYAKWIPVGSYTLTYNGNGNTTGSVPVDANNPYLGGSTVTVLGNTGALTKLSYSFSGWNTAADGNGTTYNPADTFAINADTTLYARWTPGPDYIWNDAALTGNWNTTDANWNGAAWSNSATNNAFLTTVGGAIVLDTGIVAGSVNFGNASANAPSVNLYDGDLTAASLTVQGYGSNSGSYATNPTLGMDSTVAVTGDAAVGRANLNIIGGTFTADRIISAPVSADWGRLVVSGGTVTATNGVDGSAHTSATFAIDLNGGELRTPSVKVADREQGTNNNAWLTFNGGKLTATGADNANFIQLYGGGGNTYVASGGAIIDTNSLNIGILANLLDAGGGLTKEGAGTLTLGGTNTYAGDTIVNSGTLVLADNAQLRFVVDESPAANMVTGTGTATFNGDFNIDTSAVPGTTGYIWLLVDRANLTGESFDPNTFNVVGFTQKIDGVTWEMTDARGIWTFSEDTGELTLDVGSDYDDWFNANGVTGGENDDDDADGLTNFEEYAFGLVPNNGTSVNPISAGIDKTSGIFSYTRRLQSLTGLTYTVWYSTDLSTWTEDTGATEGTPAVSGQVETVPVTVSNGLLANPKLFIQVRAN
ncbi:MAG: InlB B-repeat-containing protein [Verrucomicrobia bacterium]|nr:InlB B-repeat-containing protein [Verrucomicrobiota bacterium]